MVHETSKTTLATLANAAELARCIAQEVLGDEAANTIEGTPISRGIQYNLTLARIRNNLATFKEVI